MASRDMSFYFAVTPPAGNTHKPPGSGDPGDEDGSCASFNSYSIARRRRHGEYLHRPTIHIPSSISRTLSSLTTQSSETHLAQEPPEEIQQPTESDCQESQKLREIQGLQDQQPQLTRQHQPSEPRTDHESLPAPEMQVCEPVLTPENLEILSRSVSMYRPHIMLDRSSTGAQAIPVSGTLVAVPPIFGVATHCLPASVKGHTRMQYCRDARCLPRTPWAFKEGSLVMGIDPSYVECSPHQSLSPRDTHELRTGKSYVICRMYTDMWALCVEVSLDFPPQLDSLSSLGVNIGFLPLCAVTLPVNFASFLQRCETRRNSPETRSSHPSNGECVSAPQRHASIRASMEILNQQRNRKPRHIMVPRMVHEIYDNFLCLQRDDGDFVVCGSDVQEGLNKKTHWSSKRTGRWGLKMRKRSPIKHKLPGPVMINRPGTLENNPLPAVLDSKLVPQVSLYRYPPAIEPERSFLRRVMTRVFHR